MQHNAATPRRISEMTHRVAIMAIVNRTPDSFYDNGRTFALDRAVAASLEAVEAGATWVDIGGVPFSPDTPPVSTAEEIDRVAPVVAAVRGSSNVMISVDTARPDVAHACLQEGADVINDTNGLRSPGMAEVVAAADAGIVIAHSLAAPHEHHPQPRYVDVVAEVRQFLRTQVEKAVAAGVDPAQIVIDPGHDLNKHTGHSLELTRQLSQITDLGYPTLVALSRKDFIGEMLGRPREDRLPGTLAATALCIAAGARIVRTHDVAETVDAVRMAEGVLGLREPVEARHNR